MKCQIEKLSKQKVIFFTLVFITSCIDPFTPTVDKYQSMLVVDALVTDQDESYYCRLTRSFEDNQDTPEQVTGATVFVTDDAGGSFIFSEISPGVYRSDSLSFRGAAGRAYSLHITSAEGEQYASYPVTMLDVPEIDSLYFGKDRVTTDDGVLHEGIRIYFDSEKPVDAKYMRWTYEEYWKFRVPFPQKYDYFKRDSIISVFPPKNQTCWKYYNFAGIIIGDRDSDASEAYIKKPLTFIASDLSDRITVRYYIKVRQYSLTEDEYHFWDLLKQINEAGGDLFNRQPFQLISNIYNTETPKDQVLGYFKVSAVKDASLYADLSELKDMNLPRYRYDCSTITVESYLDYSMDEIYLLYTKMWGYVFVEPEYNDEGTAVIGLIFSSKPCGDCRWTGNPVKPDFWVDNK
jgi:hypothetical protein